jgi:acetyl esterase/lipase
MISTIRDSKKTTCKLDAEIAEAFTELAKQNGGVEKPKRGDWKTMRDNSNAGWRIWANAAPIYSDVKRKTFFTKTRDGAFIELRWYFKESSKRGPAVFYAHGGGMILGSLDL